MRRVLVLLALFCGSVLSISAQQGKITGKLTYPGEGIPSDLVLCVSSKLSGGTVHCSNSNAASLRQAKITFTVNRRAASYAISLPAGSYYVYAMTTEMPGVKAYYDEMIKCRIRVGCTSKEPIVVKITAGKTRTGITVGDFW